jgi:hypothetical protein
VALPVIALFSVSVAVSVWLPPVRSMALKVPTPLVSGDLDAAGSQRVSARDGSPTPEGVSIYSSGRSSGASGRPSRHPRSGG